MDVDKYFYAYNTATLITKDTIQLYHKSKLTPGAEAMPSWWFMRMLKDSALDLGGTVGTLKKDNEARTLSFDNHKVGCSNTKAGKAMQNCLARAPKPNCNTLLHWHIPFHLNKL